MIKLSWTVACQRALLDQTANVTLVQILEEIGIPAPPEESPTTTPARASNCVRWRR